MKTDKCKTCEKEISVLAKTCPHCGDPAPMESTGGKLFLSVLNLMGILALGYTLFIVVSCWHQI